MFRLRTLSITLGWCRLGKVGKEIEEAAAEVSKLEKVHSLPRTIRFTPLQNNGHVLNHGWYHSTMSIIIISHHHHQSSLLGSRP